MNATLAHSFARPLTCALVALTALAGAAGADESVEEKLHVHRAQSDDTAPYDAFAYLNRIQLAPSEDQPPAEYAGLILFSRLPNVEGRIQLKIVEGFDRAAYLGYKTFLRSWDEGGPAVGACVMCHTPANFTDNAEHIMNKTYEPVITPTLRNLDKSDEEIEAAIRGKMEMAELARSGDTNIDEALKLISLGDEDVANLVAFVKSLRELPAEEYRQVIVDAEILDTSDML